MHGFIQEPSVSRQPVTGQQKLKCGILIMNVDGHYSNNWLCYSNIGLRCYKFKIFKNANSWHTVKFFVFTSSDHRRRNRGRFSFLVLVFFLSLAPHFQFTSDATVYCIYKLLKKSYITYLSLVKSSWRLNHILPRDHKHCVRFKWIRYTAFSEVSPH